MKRLLLLPTLVLSGCAANQTNSVQPATQTQTIVVATSAPIAVATVAPVGSSPVASSNATALSTPATVDPAPDTNAPPIAVSEPPKSDFLVPNVTAGGGVKTYADEVMGRVDAASSSSELAQIRGDIVNNSLFFGKASQDANNEVERILNQRISTLCESLSDHARSKSDFVEGSLSQENYEKSKTYQVTAIDHNVMMVDTYFAAHRK